MTPLPKILTGKILPWPILFFAFFFSNPVHSLQAPGANTCFVYPSPARGDSAWVVYTMPSSGSVQAVLYNEAGDMVFQASERKGPGLQQTGLDLFYLRKGIYFCRVTLGLDGGGTLRLKTFKFLVVK